MIDAKSSPENRLQAAWRQGRPAFGGWLTTASPPGLSAFERTGYDYVGLDCQHGLLDEVRVADLLRAQAGNGLATLVRVMRNDSASIGKVLDAGANGVIVPTVETAEQAREAVASCQYPPLGVRSFGPFRADLGLDPREIAARAQCFVMIETAAGVAAAPQICGTPGLTGVYLGPVDLALSLGAPILPTFPPDPVTSAAIEEVARECAAAHILCGIHAGTAPAARHYARLGLRLLTMGSENQLLLRAAAEDLAGARVDTASDQDYETVRVAKDS